MCKQNMEFTTYSLNDFFGSNKLTSENPEVQDDWGWDEEELEDFVPVKVVFNNKTTICFFEDGSKIMVKAGEKDSFDPEVGVSMCIAKKVCGSRMAFLRLVENANYQTGNNEIPVVDRLLNFRVKKQRYDGTWNGKVYSTLDGYETFSKKSVKDWYYYTLPE